MNTSNSANNIEQEKLNFHEEKLLKVFKRLSDDRKEILIKIAETLDEPVAKNRNSWIY